MLHNEFRPETLDDVIGNESTKKILRKQKLDGTISHSFFLSGKYGSGKSSLARVIANDLIGNATVVEVDCGVENSADKMREISDDADFSSVWSENKVYILDEFHRLGNPAQTVLLKTLEEPPENTYFIIVTSEKAKVLPTIQSRCLSFDVEEPTKDEVRVAIKRFLAKYKIKLEDNNDWNKILKLYDNSYRVLYNLLEKIVNIAVDGFVSAEDFSATFDNYAEAEEAKTQFFSTVFLRNKPFETIEEAKKSEYVPFQLIHATYNFLKKTKNVKHIPVLSLIAGLLISKEITMEHLEKLVFDSYLIM